MTRFLDFFRLPQIRTSNFRKVVLQHTEGMVGSTICFCWKFISLSSSERILKIYFRTDKAIAMSLVYYFFGTRYRLRILYYELRTPQI